MHTPSPLSWLWFWPVVCTAWATTWVTRAASHRLPLPTKPDSATSPEPSPSLRSPLLSEHVSNLRLRPDAPQPSAKSASVRYLVSRP